MGRTSKYPNEAGIYKITCKENGKIYIGKSVNLRIRLNRHSTSKDDNLIDRAIRKYGWDSLNIEILETFQNFDKVKDKFKLLNSETYYIRLYDSTNRDIGYNICEFSNDRTGQKCSDETKERMSKSRLGHKCSEKTKEKMRNRVFSEETREKMRQAKLGNIVSSETKEKMRNARLGYKHSESAKENMSKARTGIPLSEEHNEKLSQIGKTRIFSDEHRKKLSQARKGKKLSDETKAKIGKSSLGRNVGRKHTEEELQKMQVIKNKKEIIQND